MICQQKILYSSQCINGKFNAGFCPFKIDTSNVPAFPTPGSSVSFNDAIIPLCQQNGSSVAPVCLTVLNGTYPNIPGTINDVDVIRAFNDCFSGLTGYVLNMSSNVELCDVQNWPLVCTTPTPECAALKFNGQPCPGGQSLQGIEPEICPEAMYCPNLTAPAFDCPAGHFCPSGSSQPYPCPALSYCPPNTNLPAQFIPFLVMLIVDIVIFTIIFYAECKSFWKRGESCKESCTNDQCCGGNDCNCNDCKCRDPPKLPGKRDDLPTLPLLSSKVELVVALGKSDMNTDKVLANDNEGVLQPIEEEVEKSNDNNVTQPSTAPSTTMVEEAPKLPKALLKGFAHGRDRVVELGFTFKDLSLELSNGKQVLHSVTGEVLPGHVTAVMGGSGSGKSTLLGTLRGKIPSGSKRTGVLKINGKEAAFKEYKRVVGFVPQEDVMLRELTVRDNTAYSAFIRLPSWPIKQRNEFVDAVLEALRLTHVADSVIGDELTRGISGGERKRVNIAMELACGVVGLFLDEPTSGLDSSGARTVCLTLANLAHQVGITVVMVIHQPRIDIFRSMDDLVLLAPGGYIVYHGPIDQVEDYFSSLFKVNIDPALNPADLIIDFITLYKQESIEKWKQQVVLAEQMNVKPHAAHKKIAMAIRQTSTSTLVIGVAGDDQAEKINDSKAPPENVLADERSIGAKIADIIAKANVNKSSTNIKAELAELIKSAGLIGNSEVLAEVLLQSLMNENEQNNTELSSQKSFDKDKLVNQLQNERKGASIPYQIFGAFARSMLQNYRTPRNLFLQSCISFIAGLAISAALELQSSGPVLIKPITFTVIYAVDTAPGSQLILAVFFANIAIALVSIPPGVNHFGAEQAIYFREASVGHNRFSYFVGKDIAGMVRISLDALHFTAGMLVLPTTLSYFACYSFVWVMMYCIYSIGYLSSQVMPLRMAGLFGIVVSLIISIFNGFVPQIPLGLRYIFYTWWCSNYFFTEATYYQAPVYNLTQLAIPFKYDLITPPALLLFYAALFGILMRVICFFLMIGLHRDQQR